MALCDTQFHAQTHHTEGAIFGAFNRTFQMHGKGQRFDAVSCEFWLVGSASRLSP